MNLKILSITATLLTVIFSSSIALAGVEPRIFTNPFRGLLQDIHKKPSKTKTAPNGTLKSKEKLRNKLNKLDVLYTKRCLGKKLKGKKLRKCERLLQRLQRVEEKLRRLELGKTPDTGLESTTP